MRYQREVEQKNKEISQLVETLTEAQSFLNQDPVTKETGDWSLMLFELQENIKYMEVDILELNGMSSSAQKPALLQSVQTDSKAIQQIETEYQNMLKEMASFRAESESINLSKIGIIIYLL